MIFLELGGERLGRGSGLQQLHPCDIVPAMPVGAAVVISPPMLTYMRLSELSSAFGAALCNLELVEFVQPV